ncbi:peptidoglycan DD-metalloendopeptidase family protein [Paenibacillus septentrionalis]|uniref:Peptidoglycan DD-metalloendopeptidase family protein n=1 Tax=Paenibacillus septentrionalis TaxID=429342 RepID=A0ABW1UZK1_9BACL
MNQVERDPEKMWKNDRNHWNHVGVEEHEGIEEEHRSYSFFKHMKIQFVLAILLFGSMLAMNQLDHPIVNKTKTWIKHELQQSFDFVAIAAWYEQTFQGSPSFIPNFGTQSELVIANHPETAVETSSPVEGGVLLHSFAELLNGIEVAGAAGADVRAVEKGRVILVPEQQDSVIIQHANERMSIYTRLSTVEVEVSDWVEAGTVIGKLAPIAGEDYSVLFLAMKQKDRYIDPLELITLE